MNRVAIWPGNLLQRLAADDGTPPQRILPIFSVRLDEIPIRIYCVCIQIYNGSVATATRSTVIAGFDPVLRTSY